ncbi:hypothetical protein ACPOLB_00610 [Rubrivivax sp. RP6-9]|uniref:hypothetical protein n=1 Tax=Rubrivivax sp. RP6-9 TaxID=3415750 RepID=UPI003CC6A2BE
MNAPHAMPQPPPRAVRRRLAVAAWCAVAGPALAQFDAPATEPSPYSLAAGLALVDDDNLFRSPDASAVADRHATATLRAALDQRFGRQQLQGHLAVRGQRYRQQRALDHTGHDGKLAWRGSTAGEVSWALSHESQRQLASYGTVLDPDFRGANLQTVDQTLASAQLGLLAQWVANLALGHRRVDHTAAAFEDERVRLDSVGASLQWNPLGPLSASIGPRATRGQVPGGSDGTARSFHRRDLDVGLRWVATGQSALQARLSLTHQRDDADAQGDFRGATGQVDWQWTVTGRTRLRAALSRETGSESVFLRSGSAGDDLPSGGDERQRSTAWSARLEHDLTGKITLGLDLQRTQRRLSAARVQDDGSVLLLTGHDRSGLVRLGVRYAAARSTVLTCGVTQERRAAGSVLSTPYRVDTVSCSTQITLRWS